MPELSKKTLVSRPEHVSILSKLGDAEVLLLYSVALFAIAGIQRFVDGASLEALLQFNAGEILALCAIYSVIKPRTGVIALSRADFVVISACALLMLPPVTQHFAFLGAGIAGLHFLLRNARESQLAQLGQLWLAISVYESFGRLFFRFVSGPIMHAELSFIAKIGSALGFPFSRDGIFLVSPDGWSIYMMERCSAFHNISLAILVWLSLLRLGGEEIHRPQLAALGGAVLCLVLLNGFRVLLMAFSSNAYFFWHEGVGMTIFSCATFFVVALPTALSLRRRA